MRLLLIFIDILQFRSAVLLNDDRNERWMLFSLLLSLLLSFFKGIFFFESFVSHFFNGSIG